MYEVAWSYVVGVGIGRTGTGQEQDGIQYSKACIIQPAL